MNMPSEAWIAWGIAVALVIAWGIGIELWAVWDNSSGNTLSEIVWSLKLPGFIWITIAGAVGSFVVGLTLHFIARGKLGL